MIHQAGGDWIRNAARQGIEEWRVDLARASSSEICGNYPAVRRLKSSGVHSVPHATLSDCPGIHYALGAMRKTVANAGRDTFDADLDRAPRPPEVLYEPIDEYQRLVANPFLTLFGWLAAVGMVREAVLRRNWSLFLTSILVFLLSIFVLQFHCLDCGSTGWLRRVSAPRVPRRRRASRRRSQAAVPPPAAQDPACRLVRLHGHRVRARYALARRAPLNKLRTGVDEGRYHRRLN